MTTQELEESIGKYRAMLYRLAYNSVGNHSDSEDIVEEAFIRLYTRTKEFETEEAMKAWLIRVTINLCKNRNMLCWNSRRAEPEEEIPSEGIPPDEFADLSAALQKLSPKHRTVIHMYYYEGYKTDEIAKILGISVTAVTTRLRRGREKLKNYLED